MRPDFARDSNSNGQGPSILPTPGQRRLAVGLAEEVEPVGHTVGPQRPGRPSRRCRLWSPPSPGREPRPSLSVRSSGHPVHRLVGPSPRESPGLVEPPTSSPWCDSTVDAVAGQESRPSRVSEPGRESRQLLQESVRPCRRRGWAEGVGRGDGRRPWLGDSRPSRGARPGPGGRGPSAPARRRRLVRWPQRRARRRPR